jgi:hypothetical protein
MSKATFVKELPPVVRGQEHCVIEWQGKNYVVSSIPEAPDTGQPETLVFRSDAEGNIENFSEVAGGQHMTREESIKMLEENGEQDGCNVHNLELGSVLDLIFNGPPPGYILGKDER